ncbi:hypothetical protein EN780_09965 [Mesorhizobium sp. M4B.F.Ca.ET.089.01.1.1]|uniref:hypothetical protein n=1 Tax=Mesorhizobium sp. M4B.F.Ca.ET.089.01.1.1 TaxID=2496662 RepID=UPI000FE2F5C8|nr:hypothetical protein [Mesorhizobium sp. M4B.F.Ca.ET.089.01.1.1]RWX68216.1 hypothetical protein EN780_09965 [Mesorhizobium sp. M4B.F.Ca.ET.089.01.1.1]
MHVPIGRDGTLEATVDHDDWNWLVAHKVSRNWLLRGGQVGACAPGKLEVLIGRVIVDALPGQRVVFLNGNELDLRRSNLGLQSHGGSTRHDRALLIEAATDFERRKALALAEGTYKPRYRKRVPIIVKPKQPKRKAVEPVSFDQMFASI